MAYLRPETAQGMFVNFTNVAEHQPQEAAVRHRPDRQVVPQRDHARATSCSAPASSSRWRWSTSCRPTRGRSGTSTGARSGYRWYVDLGIPDGQLRLRPHDADELSHYSVGTSDVEFLFPWGWDELEGIANRTDYDLKAHAEHSGEKLDYFDQATNDRYMPHVIEPAAGATRTMMAFLIAAYDEDEVRGETRTVLRLHPRLAPYKVAVLPLSKKPELTEPAREVLRLLQPHFMCDYDETQAIGRRYRRQDEIGTPVLRHGRLRVARRPARSPSATATRWSRSGSRSTSWSTTCRSRLNR